MTLKSVNQTTAAHGQPSHKGMISALDEIKKVLKYWEAMKTNPSTARLTISGEVLTQAADELAALQARIRDLEKALKLSAEMNHGNMLAFGGGHKSGDFKKCTNGYCMEAAAALHQEPTK